MTIGSGTTLLGASVAVESNGTAIVSWADQSAPTANVVRWCVLAPGAGSCSAGGILTPASAPTPTQVSVYGTQVLVEGPILEILADVSTGKTEDESVQEWQSTNGGQTFTPVNGGKAVASGNTSINTRMTNAVTLPGNLNVGVGFVTSSYEPTFHSFSIGSPTLCGREAGKCADGFATLGSEANVDKVGNPAANFAADGDNVLGVFRTNYSTGNFGCPGATPFGMAYVFGDGLQSPANNYNVSPGSANSAWRTTVSLVDCDVDYLALGGGPAGFGVLEDNQVTHQTQYHRFDSATDTFDIAPVVVSSATEQQPSVSQDGAGGVYATYLSGGIGGPVSLSYSVDGGTSWTGPGTLAADPLGAVASLTSAVSPAGQGWATWVENGSLFAQPFTAADAGSSKPPVTVTSTPPSKAATTMTTTQKAAGQSGASLTVPAGTTGETDQATIVGANSATASGTIRYELYASPSCASSSAVAASTLNVTAGKVPPSSAVAAALAPGKYYWEVIYGGDFLNGQSVSACGSEVLTVLAPNAIAATATSNGQALTVGVSCTKVPCTVQTTATAPAAGASASSTKSHKPKPIVLGKGKFKLTKKGTQKLTIKLSAKGRHYLKGKHKAKASLAVTEKIGSHSVVTMRMLTVKVTPPKHSKK